MSARAVVVVVVVAAVACGRPSRPVMYPAGSDKDDGYGDLAQQSAHLSTSDDDDAPFPPHHRHHADGAPYGGDPYGAAYNDDDDPSDAVDLRASRWGRLHARNPPHATPATALTGAIEGTVTWRGARPPALTTACGTIEHPSVRVAAGRAVAGVVVYIEHVEAGRAVPSYPRPAGVGGLIVKHGCVLAPASQILTPLPGELAIHGDAAEVRLRVTSPGETTARPFTLQEAGRVVVQAQPGVTRVEADDGSLAAAWVVAADTPYYAITDDAGRFRIDELAAGTYDLTFWQPPVATARAGQLIYGAPVVVHRSIKVDPARPAHLDVALGP
ncbi:MAG TPA: carboxypeptidase-like regulatory domain-containing protein [Kofleriaceae bacterium]|nr:carboxypeptidase-like regulatory domain-containing protein [Kofleriaceae bacterium]